MRMPRPIPVVLLGGACLMLVLAGASCSKRSPEKKLVDSLRKDPVFEVDSGLTWSATGPSVIRPRAWEAVAAGIKLLPLYRDHLGEHALRVQLAYLMLLSENWSYVMYAEDHLSELGREHEFTVWLTVLEEDPPVATERYRDAMERVLEQVDLPYAVLHRARVELARGDPNVAIRKALRILRTEAVWDVKAYEFLKSIPEGDRTELLLPYIETPSEDGAAAATILAESPGTKKQAMAYLETMKQSGTGPLKSAAVKALWEVRQSEQFRKE